MGEESSETQGFAFVKVGEFSHTNRVVLEQLQTRFPDLEPTIIDLQNLEFVRRRDVPGLVLCVASEFGAAACTNLQRLRLHIHKTTCMMRRTRAALLARLDGRRFAFTFQTQSLFDSSLPGIPHFIYTDHTHLENLKYPLPEAAGPLSRSWAKLERSIYHNARMIFTMSANVARSVIDEYGCPAQKVECVYAGSNVSTELSGDIDGSRYRAKHVLFVGVDWERKGGPVLLEAFRILRRSHPDARLTIVGCSPPVTEPGVHVAGRVPLREVPRFYRAASVFCLPTLNEPFGLVFLEAGAYGLPVVATPIGAIPEIVLEGETGCLVPPQNPRELASRLASLIVDPERCERMGARAREWIGQRYSWERTGERIATLIESSTGRVPQSNTADASRVPSRGTRLAAV